VIAKVLGQLGSAAIGESRLGFWASTLRMLSMRITTKKSRNGYMHNPPHPGEVLKKLCLEPLGLSITKAAKALGVSRNSLASILKGQTGISPEMAVRLSIAFETTAESWMNQQMQYDLWQAKQHRDELNVTCLTLQERSLQKAT